jgi:alpha-N-arabinofuranosidase
MLLQTIFYPFAMYSSRREGIALLPSVSGPAYDSPSYGQVNTIDTSAILGDGVLHTFLVNRNINETAEIEIDHGRGKLVSVISADVVSGSGPDARNTYEDPNVICSQPLQTVKVSGGRASLQLPPLSVAAITFSTD